MAITGIANNLVNGVREIVSAQNVPANTAWSATDETLNFRATLSTNNQVGATLTFTNCLLNMPNGMNQGLNYGSPSVSNGKISVLNSQILWTMTSGRRNMRLSELKGSSLRVVGSNAASPAFLYLQNGGVFDEFNGRPNILDGIYVLEVSGRPTKFAKTQFVNCGMNLLNYSAGELEFRGVKLGAGTVQGADGDSFDAWLNANGTNAFHWFSCELRHNRLACAGGGTVKSVRYWAVAEKFVDENGRGIENVSVNYEPKFPTAPAYALKGVNVKTNFKTNANGYLTLNGQENKVLDLPVEWAVADGSSRSTGLSDPSQARNYTLLSVTWNKRVRHPQYVWSDTRDVRISGDIGAAQGEILGAGQSVILKRDVDFTASSLNTDGRITFAVSADGGVNVGVIRTATLQDIYNQFKIQCASSESDFANADAVRIENDTLHINGRLTVYNGGVLNTTERLRNLAVSKAVNTVGNGVLNISYTDADRAGFVSVEGVDNDQVQLRLYDDHSVIASQTGNGQITFGSNRLGAKVYLARVVGNVVLASTYKTPITLKAGSNGDVKLYFGDQIQTVGLGNLHDKLLVINRGVERVSHFPPKRHKEKLPE